MVLSIIIFLFQLWGVENSLLLRYEKQVNKIISKELSLDKVQLAREEFSRGELYRISNANKSEGFLLVAEVAACRLGGCSTFEKLNDNKSSEYFDLLLLVDENKSIVKVSILDYYSEYGYEVTSRKYLKKFTHKNICNFSNDSDDIDAVSGATVSSYALEAMIGSLCEFI